MRRPATVAFDRRRGQSQDFLHGQCDAVRPCLRQRQLVSVSALVEASQRRVVGVADEPDRHAPLVPQVVERLPDLFGEGVGNGSVLVLVSQWHDKVPDPRPRRLAFLVSHLADGLRPADLDELGFIGPFESCAPFPKGLVAGQMPLDRLAGLDRVDLADARGTVISRIRQSAVEWRCLLIPFTCSPSHVRRAVRRAATAPEDLRLNGQHIAVFLRIPRFGQLPLNRLHALFD